MGLSNIILCFTCFIISGILCYTYIHRNNTKTDLLSKIFVCFINEIELFCINEMVSSLRLIIPGFPSIISMITFTLFYMIIFLLSITWVVYIIVYYKGTILQDLPIIITYIIFTFIETILLCINLKSPFIFDVSPEGNFVNLQYGFFVVSPIYLFNMLVVIYSIYKFAKEKNIVLRKRYFGVALFAVIPFIYGFLQLFFPDVSLDAVGFTLGVLIVYIYSISKKEEDEAIIQKNLQKDTIVKCVHVLYNYNSTEVAIDKILTLIARYHNAEQAFIFEIDKDEKKVQNTYKWCKKISLEPKEKFNNLSFSLFSDWITSFEKSDTYTISSVENEIKKNTEEYGLLEESNVHSLMAVPIRDKEKLVGFLGITNSDSNQNDYTVMHAVSSIIYSEILRRKHGKQDDEVIKILASEFSSVLYTNLKDGYLIPYSLSDEAIKTYGAILEKGISYERAIKIFIEREVYPADIEKMKKYSNIQYLIQELKQKKSISVIFRTNNNGSPVYHEVKFVKIDDEDKEPTALAIGFSNKMYEVISQYVITQLLESYSSVYYIDFPANKIRAFKQSETMEIGKFTEEMPYDSVVHSFADNVDPAYKPLWDRLADVHEAQNLLMEENCREIIYEVSNLEYKKRRAFWKVIDRQDGIPITAIVSFMGIDKATSEEYDMQQKIAEQKEALESQAILIENALREAQIANKEKTEFLSNMSHDIRTPINAIIGFTELALQNIDDKEKIKDYMLKSNVSSQHLLSLINDILEMNRIESGKFILNETIVGIPEIINDVETILRGMADSKKQTLKLEKLEISNEYIYCDKLRINQVIINLLSNAIKYTPKGGDIKVSVVQKNVVNNMAEYEFRVKDNGIGMSQEFVKRIFEPFERDSLVNQTGTQGAGLGMAITKNIVDMMNGTINVKTKEGKGTEFIVNVKFKIADKKNLQQKEQVVFDEELIKGKRILVVEDNEMNREIAEEILKENNFIVESAEDGKYAVEMVKKSEPGYYDVILMDIRMPLMDGYTATKEIRNLENKALANIPIIAMTANAFAEDKEESRKAGMNEHISKPISIESLLKVITRFL